MEDSFNLLPRKIQQDREKQQNLPKLLNYLYHFTNNFSQTQFPSFIPGFSICSTLKQEWDEEEGAAVRAQQFLPERETSPDMLMKIHQFSGGFP